MNINLKTIRTTTTNPDFISLVFLLDQHLIGRYGDVQHQYDEYNNVEELKTALVVYDNNKAVGCGCFKQKNTCTIEIKRMFVRDDFRGKGIAKMILNGLEQWGLELGFTVSILETGTKQFEAIALYASCGYHKIENYGQYIGMETSECYKKIIVD